MQSMNSQDQTNISSEKPTVRKRSSATRTTTPIDGTTEGMAQRKEHQLDHLHGSQTTDTTMDGQIVHKIPTIVSNEDEKSISNLWGFLSLGTKLLENKGSVARDHMANERTFLSWIRTSLGLATVGVGITQLFKLVEVDSNKNNPKQNEFLVKAGKPIGATFISIAIICVILGSSRFFRTQHLLQENLYPASRLSVSLVIFLILIISIATLVTVLYDNTR